MHSPLSKTTKMLLKSLRKCWAPYYEEKNEGQGASSISILLMTSSTTIRTTHTTPPNHTTHYAYTHYAYTLRLLLVLGAPWISILMKTSSTSLRIWILSWLLYHRLFSQENTCYIKRTHSTGKTHFCSGYWGGWLLYHRLFSQLLYAHRLVHTFNINFDEDILYVLKNMDFELTTLS